MSQDEPRLRRLRGVFQAALELTPPARAGFLQEACAGDEALLHEALAMLNSHERSGEGPDRDLPVTEAITDNPLRPNVPSRFEVMAPLGEGGYGRVFKAYDREQKITVALKVLHRKEPDALYRFKREFRSLADLYHTNLIRLYDLFQHEDCWFFSMELVEGQSIVDYVLDAERIDLVRLRDTFKALASTVAWLHSRGLIHRDLKPSNILVSNSGRVVVLDFGLAFSLGPGSHSGTALVGTPAYMAPELACSGEVTEAVDWYSIGVILYESLTGKRPFDGEMPHVLVEKACADPMPPLEIDPSIPSEWSDTCMQLLSRDPAKRISTADKLLRQLTASASFDFASARTQQSALVGRDDVLQLLLDACERAFAGRTCVIDLAGPSGRGKTKILDIFTAMIRRRFPGALVIRSRCYEHESVPFKAIDPMVDQMSRELRLLGRRASGYIPENIGLLARLFPVLDEFTGLGEAEVSGEITNPEELRRIAFNALAELLERLSASRLIVICLDDLQWGDADSADLFHTLLNVRTPTSLAIIASYRSDAEDSGFLHSWRFELERVGERIWKERMELGPLTPEASLQLARILMDGREASVSEEVITAVARESGGEPLLLEQLAADWKHYGTQQRGASVRQLISRRINALSEPARGLLYVIAAAAEPIPEVLIKNLALTSSRVSDVISTLISQNLIRRRQGESGVEFETYHDQLRASIMENLPANKVQTLHLQIAEGLVKAGFGDSGVIAVHYVQAGDTSKAASYAMKGAIEAEAVFAFDRAVRLYRIALEAGAFNEEQKGELYERMGRAFAAANQLSGAVEAYLQGAALAGTAARRAELQRHAAEQLLCAGKLREGLNLLRSAAAGLRIRQTNNALTALVFLLYLQTKLKIRASRHKLRAEVELPPLTLARLDVYWALASGLGMGNPVIGYSALLRYLDLALSAGEPKRIALGLAAQAGFLAARGIRNYSQSQALLQQAIETGTKLNDPLVLGTARAFQAMSGYLTGRWQQAMDCGRQAEEMLRRHCAAVSWQLSVARMARFGGHFLAGKWAPLNSLMESYADDASRRGDALSLSVLKISAWSRALSSDDPETASKNITNGEQLFSHIWGDTSVHSAYLVATWGRIGIAIYTSNTLANCKFLEERLKRINRSSLMRVETFRTITLLQEGALWLAAAKESRTDGSRRRFLARAAVCAKELERSSARWAAGEGQLIRGSIEASNGNYDRACVIWEEAERELQLHERFLQAAAVRFWRAHLTKDTELKRSAIDAFRTEGVICPERWAATLVPSAIR